MKLPILLATTAIALMPATAAAATLVAAHFNMCDATHGALIFGCTTQLGEAIADSVVFIKHPEPAFRLAYIFKASLGYVSATIMAAALMIAPAAAAPLFKEIPTGVRSKAADAVSATVGLVQATKTKGACARSVEACPTERDSAAVSGKAHDHRPPRGKSKNIPKKLPHPAQVEPELFMISYGQRPYYGRLSESDGFIGRRTEE